MSVATQATPAVHAAGDMRMRSLVGAILDSFNHTLDYYGSDIEPNGNAMRRLVDNWHTLGELLTANGESLGEELTTRVVTALSHVASYIKNHGTPTYKLAIAAHTTLN